MRKIVIFPRGTGLKREDELINVGLGHISSCLNLAKQLRRMNAEIWFAASGIEYELARESGFKTVKIPTVGYNSPHFSTHRAPLLMFETLLKFAFS